MNNNDKVIKNKVGLLNLSEELGNISKACRIMGYSRDTFYRYKELVNQGGLDNLIDRTRRKPNLKNRIDEKSESAVKEMAIEYPAYGQVRVSNELRKEGIMVSASGVRSIWLRHNLSNFKSRLKALEKKVETDGIILIDAQNAGFEEIEAFCEEKKRKPKHGENNDIFERLYAVRLEIIQASAQRIPCNDFSEFQDMFNQVTDQLKTGVR